MHETVKFHFEQQYLYTIWWVELGSQLGTLQANVFMVSRGEDLMQTLKSCLCNWKRFLDDTHAYVEPPKVEFILKQIKYLSCGHQLLNSSGEKQWIKLFGHTRQKN